MTKEIRVRDNREDEIDALLLGDMLFNRNVEVDQSEIRAIFGKKSNVVLRMREEIDLGRCIEIEVTKETHKGFVTNTVLLVLEHQQVSFAMKGVGDSFEINKGFGRRLTRMTFSENGELGFELKDGTAIQIGDCVTIKPRKPFRSV